MGGSQSTRKLTLVNDEKAGVIKLSENLAYRLRGQIEQSQASSGGSPPPKPSLPPYSAPPPPPPQIAPPQPSRTEGSSTGPSNGPSDPWTGLYAEEARKALLRLQEDQDLALAAVENRWKLKMEQREKEFVEASKLSLSELEKTANEVEAAFVKSRLTAVCQDNQSQVLDCYKNNQSQTLKCADSVQQFTRCVDLTRLESVMKDSVRKV